MNCVTPLQAYWSRVPNANGKHYPVFNRDDSTGQTLELPCGQCIACRLEKSRQWAVRCVHEAKEHDQNSFITLTYDDDHLPHDCGLDITHWQKFVKRLRKKIGAKKIRYYHAGEYGDQFGRPHYHACIFGLQFQDVIPIKQLPSGHTLYQSPTLTKLWGKGHASTADFTFETAAYVARYTLKKINGEKAEDHYKKPDPITGELHQVQPEYSTMSKGIGSAWYKKYKDDCYPRDRLVFMRGDMSYEMKPPAYYDRLHEALKPDEMEEIRTARSERAKLNKESDFNRNNRHEILVAQQNQISRKLK